MGICIRGYAPRGLAPLLDGTGRNLAVAHATVPVPGLGRTTSEAMVVAQERRAKGRAHIERVSGGNCRCRPVVGGRAAGPSAECDRRMLRLGRDEETSGERCQGTKRADERLACREVVGVASKIVAAGRGEMRVAALWLAGCSCQLRLWLSSCACFALDRVNEAVHTGV